MKNSVLTLLLTGAVAVWACNNTAQKTDDSVDAAKEANENSTVVAVDEADSKFAVKTADIGMAEVELGKLAQEKATNPAVKRFADMMVMDHTKGNDELKTMAATKNITLPATVGEDHQEKMTKLSQKSGKDFDKDYMDAMVNGHKDAIDLFEKQANDGKDMELKTFANNMLPTLRAHLDSAKAIRDMLK